MCVNLKVMYAIKYNLEKFLIKMFAKRRTVSITRKMLLFNIYLLHQKMSVYSSYFIVFLQLYTFKKL